MLEVNAHESLKKFYRNNLVCWPHNLTLTRLISRSLRRKDNTLIQLFSNSKTYWWTGLLIPLCLHEHKIVLVLSAKQRKQLIEVQLPKLRSSGLFLEYEEGIPLTSLGKKIWILSTQDFFVANEKGLLQNCQLIFPESEFLSSELRKSMSIEITPQDWEDLIYSHPRFKSSIIEIHERLSRRLFSQAASNDAAIRLDNREILLLKEMIEDTRPAPTLWEQAFNVVNDEWVTWAQLDHQILSWNWHLQPLNPLQMLSDLSTENALLILRNSGEKVFLSSFSIIFFSISFDCSFFDFVSKPNPVPKSLSCLAPKFEVIIIIVF